MFPNYGYVVRRSELDTFVGSQIEARPASRIAPLTGTVGLRWNSTDGKWFLEGAATLARHQDRLSPGDEADTQRIPPGGTPGYTLATLRAGWRATDALTLTASVENVFNEAYRIHGSGVNEAGANFIFGAELRF